MEVERPKSLVLDLETLSKFEMPDKPPELQNPRFVKSCAGCNVPFKKGTIVGKNKKKKNKSKKVCKFCGNVFCLDCAVMKVHYPPSFNYDKPKRVCDGCLPILLLSRNRKNRYSVPNILRRKSIFNLSEQAEEGHQELEELKHDNSENSDDNIISIEQELNKDLEKNEINNHLKRSNDRELLTSSTGDSTTFASSGKGKISMNLKLKDYVGKALLWYSGAREGKTFDRTTIAKLSARKMKMENVHKVEDISIKVPYTYSTDLLNLEKYNIKELPKVKDENAPDFFDLRMRVYYPQEPDPNNLLPVLVWYHGGAFVIGDPTDSVVDKTMRTICNRTNCVIVSVAYRLAPEFKFPTQPEDSYNALLWVHEKGEQELCIDPSRIAVGGDSAGGNLATVVCLIAKDRNGPRVCHQVLIYPAVQGADMECESHITFAKGPILNRNLLLWAKYQYLPDDNLVNHPYVSPYLAEDFTDLPSATVIASFIDPLRDHSEDYANKMKRAGVLTTFTMYKNSAHGFFYADSQESKEAVAEVCSNIKFYFEISRLEGR